VIFGVAVVFPVVITFGVAGVLAGRHAQAAVQGFFPWSSASALMCAGEQRSRPLGGNVASYTKSASKISHHHKSKIIVI